MSETSPPDPVLLAKLASGDVTACLDFLAGLDNDPSAWMFHQAAKLTGSAAVAPDGRRIADIAAGTLTRVLDLQTSFAPRPAGQYTAAELSEVRTLVRGRVPQ